MLLLLLLLQEPAPPVDASPPGEGLHVSAGASARLSFLTGALGDFTATAGGLTFDFDDTLRWFDCFEPGPGANLELFLGLTPQPPAGSLPRGAIVPSLFGLYLSLDAARFEGVRESDGLVSVRPDELNATSIFVGFKGGTLVDVGLTGDILLGIGVVRIEAVDAEFGIGGVTAMGELFDDSIEIAGEARLRFGLELGRFVLSLGGGARVMTPPDAGESADFRPGVPWVLDAELALEVRF
jgi:hypothetical protein